MCYVLKSDFFLLFFLAFLFLTKRKPSFANELGKKTHTATNSTPSNLYAYHQGETQKRLLTLFLKTQVGAQTIQGALVQNLPNLGAVHH